MILKVAWRNIFHKPLNSALSWLLLSVSVGIISLLLLLEHQLKNDFNQSIRQVDMVIGAKGSPLQLILSAVYHIDAPTGNIPYAEAQKWMKHPYVEWAIPLAYGDSYKGYSIVGSTPAYPAHYATDMALGRMYKNDFDVVVGSSVASQLGLKPGSQFFGMHGNDEHGEQHKEHAYTVTGILKPSGTAVDNLLLCNIESVWKIHHHHHQEETGAQHEADTIHEKEEPEKEITAALIKFRSPLGFIQLPRIINERTNLMAALPSIEINRLFTLFGVAISTLKNIGWGIMLLSALSVFVALFNSLKERKYELALMRTLGAGRNQLLWLLLLEGLILTIAGFVTGLLLSRMGLWLIVQEAGSNYHFTIDQWMPQWPGEAGLFLLTLLLGIAGALIPALRAWFLNISKTLSHA